MDKDEAKAKLAVLTEKADAAEARAKRLRGRQRRFLFKQQRNGNLTYREISEIIGRSEIRVAQILREERERDGA